MRVDSTIGSDLRLAPLQAQQAEAFGYDGVFTAETSHDPFYPLVVAAEHTDRIELGTGIAVAFARTPMTMAGAANDVQLFSQGRLILGLGSQIQAHITKRFSMPWSKPAARMREFILAMRAIWACWNDGTPLRFEGEFYRHTLMTPFFHPGPNPHGAPQVHLAAVGELMAEVAGEVADGVLCHPFTTQRYLTDVTLPAVEKGLAKSGRRREQLQFSLPVFVVAGDTEEQVADATAAVKNQIAFYGSTPAYRGVLELHGWGELQTELNALSKEGKWAEMGDRIDDEILDTVAVRGGWADVPRLILDRYGDLVDRVSFYAPYRADAERWAEVVAALKA